MNVDEYGIRFRLSEEQKVTSDEMEELENIGFVDGKEIVFRYRQRISYAIVSTKAYDIQLDVTYIQMDNNKQRGWS